jgi:hypothetical protein
VAIFKEGIAIAGGLAAASFAVGAIMYAMSGVSPEMANSGKDRMRGAVLGIVLLACSWTIMNTINPKLVGTSLSPISPQTPPDTTLGSGVYLFSDSACQSPPEVIADSLATIDSNIKAYSIVNDDSDPTDKIDYGVIFHQNNGLQSGGLCSDNSGQPITQATCKPVPFNGALSVFQLNPDPKTSGSGVEFYSEPYGSDRGTSAGYYMVKGSDITLPSLEKDPTAMQFLYTNIKQTDAYESTYKYFADRPGSMDLNGDYLVALFSQGTSGLYGAGGKYCETFIDDAKNLNAEPIIASGTGTGKLTNIEIIPIK